ncbi:MAG: TraR/DksA C4-type zinc finger protein [Crocinitomicaceae bacterium]|nr:TraR/DksA C4-type zinc finger protein [Crocinitomicaceae bacterium]
MTIAEKKAIKNKIKEEIEKTRSSILDYKESTKPISPENAIGRISRMDAINNKSVLEAALRKAEEKLTRLRVVESKIDSQDFGDCIRCGNSIPIGRILLMPQSRKCVRCAN